MSYEQDPCMIADLRASVDAVVSCHVDKVGLAMNWVGDEPALMGTDLYYCANCDEQFYPSDDSVRALGRAWQEALDHLTKQEVAR
ncbi:hypothetical protein [Streptomyces brasiliscabiei]|uniref:hypothetical protein n=1 Tax=Streptomyces brasiliscabiei TaxID=2736302 RepID=UPI001C0FEF30|nr:hypothetical protein [Streptomyces brasiliscabiei]